MISPVTWLWNIRHRKLIEETKQIMRFYCFLRYDCGLKEVDKFSAADLKQLLLAMKSGKIELFYKDVVV